MCAVLCPRSTTRGHILSTFCFGMASVGILFCSHMLRIEALSTETCFADGAETSCSCSCAPAVPEAETHPPDAGAIWAYRKTPREMAGDHSNRCFGIISWHIEEKKSCSKPCLKASNPCALPHISWPRPGPRPPSVCAPCSVHLLEARKAQEPAPILAAQFSQGARV